MFVYARVHNELGFPPSVCQCWGRYGRCIVKGYRWWGLDLVSYLVSCQ